MKRGDKIVYIGVALTVLISLFFSYLVLFRVQTIGIASFEVLVDGVRVRAGELPRGAQEPMELLIASSRGFNILSVSQDGVVIVSADCPGGDCLRFPRIERAGRTIVCLPHRLLVRLVASGSDDRDGEPLDALAY